MKNLHDVGLFMASTEEILQPSASRLRDMPSISYLKGVGFIVPSPEADADLTFQN